MKDAQFQFYIEGPDAGQAADELAEIFQAEFAHQPERRLPETGGQDPLTKTDPLAVAAIILAIPSAVLATIDLISRLQKKEKLDRVLAQSHKIEKTSRAANPDHHPRGTSIELSKTNSAEVLDLASAAEQGK